ncbi:MAG TPA: hypothetical protein VG992_03925 [Candidatus Saccharimonadales bacterium]|nr:hypothetical protein [Candidatus Saccharimonadales bacterium]
MTKTKFAALILLIGASWPGLAAAASAPNGITLSPFEQSVKIQAGDVAKSFQLKLTNHTKSLQELRLTVRDFGSLNQTGGIALKGSNTYTKKYGLTDWMSLEKDVVDLNAGETARVLVTINNQSSLTPGGHYGAIIASVNSLNQSPANNVVINQQLVALVLVDKVGGERYAMKLTDETNNGNWFHLPTQATLTFQNAGNVQVVPRGLVKLVGPTGSVVAQGVINTGSAFILPETFRQFSVPLQKVASAHPWPGLYHLEVDYRYDGISNHATKRYFVHFIDLGLYLVLAVMLVILFVFRRPILRRLKARQ